MALNLDSLGLSAKVTAEGISAPDYQTILSTLISYFQQIYGSDAYSNRIVKTADGGSDGAGDS
ncbi:putative phage related protein [Escherichia coli]|uniref:Putative phage related protein n=1 Tax=Escherichia coli TaxID=562 RepID=A0A2X1KTV0_ECOLX|nr:putative phage related protein [Escherichia coli]